jgi:hypothetical protein
MEKPNAHFICCTKIQLLFTMNKCIYLLHRCNKSNSAFGIEHNSEATEVKSHSTLRILIIFHNFITVLGELTKSWEAVRRRCMVI